MLAITDRKGQPSGCSYDALDRLTAVTYADGSRTAYTLDAGNHLTQITDSLAGPITRSYDTRDLLTVPRLGSTRDEPGRV